MLALHGSRDAERPRPLSPGNFKGALQSQRPEERSPRRAQRPPPPPASQGLAAGPRRRLSAAGRPGPRPPQGSGGPRSRRAAAPPGPGQYSHPQGAPVFSPAGGPRSLRLLRIAPLLGHEHHGHSTTPHSPPPPPPHEAQPAGRAAPHRPRRSAPGRAPPPPLPFWAGWSRSGSPRREAAKNRFRPSGGRLITAPGGGRHPLRPRNDGMAAGARAADPLRSLNYSVGALWREELPHAGSNKRCPKCFIGGTGDAVSHTHTDAHGA